MSCIIACGLLANHGIVKGGEMSPKVDDNIGDLVPPVAVFWYR